MKINISSLEKKLNINFKDKNLLIKSLTHKSFDKNNNNEKIEFLGDSSNVYWSLELFAPSCTFILFILPFDNKKSSTKIEDKVIADACEALIGAVYLDKGFSEVEVLILKLWSKNIKDSVITQIDAKTKLQEFSLKKYKKLPNYKIISNTGPRHKPIFKVGVKLYNSKFYIAEGNSKKDAEQNAAILCLNDKLKIWSGTILVFYYQKINTMKIL